MRVIRLVFSLIYIERSLPLLRIWFSAGFQIQSPSERGYFLWWPLRGGSVCKGFPVFRLQASDTWILSEKLGLGQSWVFMRRTSQIVIWVNLHVNSVKIVSQVRRRCCRQFAALVNSLLGLQFVNNSTYFRRGNRARFLFSSTLVASI